MASASTRASGAGSASGLSLRTTLRIGCCPGRSTRLAIDGSCVDRSVPSSRGPRWPAVIDPRTDEPTTASGRSPEQGFPSDAAPFRSSTMPRRYTDVGRSETLNHPLHSQRATFSRSFRGQFRRNCAAPRVFTVPRGRAQAHDLPCSIGLDMTGIFVSPGLLSNPVYAPRKRERVGLRTFAPRGGRHAPTPGASVPGGADRRRAAADRRRNAGGHDARFDQPVRGRGVLAAEPGRVGGRVCG